MTVEFILAQICGFIVLVLMVFSVWFNDNKKIVFISIIANIFATTQYFLLWALTGAIISIINTIRCLIFYLYKKKGMKPNVLVLVLFEVVAVVSGALSWQSWWSLIPILMAVIYTYGLWQDNTFIIKLATGISGAGWTAYNIVVKAYVSAAQSVTQFISVSIAIIKDRVKKNKDSVATESLGNETNKNIDINDVSKNSDEKA